MARIRISIIVQDDQAETMKDRIREILKREKIYLDTVGVDIV